MSNNELPFGIDVSEWQGKINWDMVAENRLNVEYAFIRSGIGIMYQDKMFERNWKECKRVGIPCGAYHVLIPMRGEAWTGTKQAEYALEILDGDYGQLPIVCDLEQDNSQSRDVIRQSVYEFGNTIHDETEELPLLYSRTEWVNYHLIGAGRKSPHWLKQYYWWMALYRRDGKEHQGPVRAPYGIAQEKIICHQNSDKLSLGQDVTQSKATDRNRWLAGREHFERFQFVRCDISFCQFFHRPDNVTQI